MDTVSSGVVNGGFVETQGMGDLWAFRRALLTFNDGRRGSVVWFSLTRRRLSSSKGASYLFVTTTLRLQYCYCYRV